MKRLTIVLAAVLAASLPVVLAQEAPGPAGPEKNLPGGLDELIATALRQNPDVLVAEAAVRHAQATLNQVRLKTAQTVASLHVDLRAARAHLEARRGRLAEIRKLVEAGNVSQAELRKAAVSLAEADAAVARIDAKLRYELGMDREGDESATTRAPDTLPAVADGAPRPAMPDELRAVLRLRQLSPRWNGTPLSEVCDELEKAAGGAVNLVVDQAIQRLRVHLILQREVSINEAMTALAESFHDLDDEQLSAYAIPGHHNIASLVMHVLSNLDVYAVGAQGMPRVTPHDLRWDFYDHPEHSPTPGEPCPTRAELTGAFSAVRKAATETMQQADERDLLRLRAPGNREESGNSADRYVRTIFHTMAHVRQIWPLRGALGLVDGTTWPQQHWA